MQRVNVMYVDNAKQVHKVLQKIIYTSRVGGIIVKQDLFHVTQRFKRALPRNHKDMRAFLRELGDALLPPYLPDLQAGVERDKARRYNPPGTGSL
jgi:hypothetical protein